MGGTGWYGAQGGMVYRVVWCTGWYGVQGGMVHRVVEGSRVEGSRVEGCIHLTICGGSEVRGAGEGLPQPPPIV